MALIHSQSRLAITSDLLFCRMLIWIASVGRDAEITRDAHLFLADRYGRLAKIHEHGRRPVRARRLREKAEEHFAAAGWDGPPFAAAMGMPRPKRPTFTNAVSGSRRYPDDVG